MRHFRPLILLGILAILGAVGGSYYLRVEQRTRSSPHKPKELPPNTLGTAHEWVYDHTNKNKTVAEVRAKDYRQVKEPNQFELEGVELRIFNKDGSAYRKVTSAKADFDLGTGVMFSKGDVEITLNVPADHRPSGKLMVIHSSGVRFETKTGKVTTDQPARFEFDRGKGSAVGASYDPDTGDLHMNSQVKLEWTGLGPHAKVMNIEAGELTYKEKESKVYLAPWSKLVRDNLTMTGGPAVITLVDQAISTVDAQKARGVQNQPGRQLTFAADEMFLNFDDNTQVNKIQGRNNAELVSHSKSGTTTIHTDRIDMDLDTADRESVLQTALASGHSVIESKPAAPANGVTPETRILRSDVIKTTMKPGGQDIDRVETESPGTLEFAPNGPGQPHRWINGERIGIQYADGNQIQSLRTVHVTTRTEKPKTAGAKQAPPPALTSSQDMQALFDPKTGQLATVEQWGGFRYQAGDRQAKADKATFDKEKNVMVLTGGARVWDSTGLTSAGKIVLDQGNGDFSADGDVNSTRMPDKQSGANGMLAQDEPLHARARKMTSTDGNLNIRYDGGAVLWQGANLLQADVVEIDRDNGVLKAHGNVISQLQDKKSEKKRAAAGNDQAPLFTVVTAPEMVYTDDTRLADYTGGALLDRPGLRVKSKEIRAFLKPPDDPKENTKNEPKDPGGANAAGNQG
ncbi:MAG: LPS export ABC transporter periplasmic protein LptC, partial [Bryobacteraceae bacterium]